MDDVRSLKHVAREIKSRPKPFLMRQAVVTAVTAPTVSIEIGNDGVVIPDVKCFDHYTPRTVGDTVWVFVNGADMMVNGKLS